jgi:sugar phosphate isomerase/epimerase
MVALLVITLCSHATLRATTSITNAPASPFGAFTLGMDDHTPAQLVELMQGLGYDGLMAHTWGKDPLPRLRAYLDVPAVKSGAFRVYAILWTPKASDGFDTNWLAQVLAVAKPLHASLWVAVSGQTNEMDAVIDLLARSADQCAQFGVDLVLYPHFGHPYDTLENTLPLLKKLNRPNVKVSIHLCHEMKAGNENRFDEIVAKAAPYLALASINGAELGDAVRRDKPADWRKAIMPLDEGALDVKPFLRALAKNGYHGPVLLHTFGLKTKPEDHLARSIKKWRELQSELKR